MTGRGYNSNYQIVQSADFMSWPTGFAAENPSS